MAARPRAAKPRTIEKTELDGIPVFFVEGKGPTVAGLLFRVGQADEAVQRRGISHLVEHLALAPLGEQKYQHNGTVEGAQTTFLVRGTPREVASFLRAVCVNLGSLPLERTRLEARILRTEASSRSPSVANRMAYYRFGFTGLGTMGLPEYYLNDPRPGPVVEWAASRFNRANCVLWLVGTMPKDLALPLAEGPRYPLPPTHQIPYLTLPATLSGPSDCVAIDFLSRRTSVATTITRIAAKRLLLKVRLERGLTYLVAGEREGLSTTSAEDTLWLTCLPEQATQVRADLLGILEDLASRGPTQEELDEDLDQFLRACLDPESRYQDVAFAAAYALIGMEPSSMGELIDERRSVTLEACVAELRESLTTAILAAPATAGKAPTGFHDYPVNVAPVSGTTLRPRTARPWQKTATMVVGPDGVSRVDTEGHSATVRWNDCVAFVIDGDGIWRLLAGDGFAIEFRPEDWANSAVLTNKVDQLIPAELRIGPPA